MPTGGPHARADPAARLPRRQYRAGRPKLLRQSAARDSSGAAAHGAGERRRSRAPSAAAAGLAALGVSPGPVAGWLVRRMTPQPSAATRRRCGSTTPSETAGPAPTSPSPTHLRAAGAEPALGTEPGRLGVEGVRGRPCGASDRARRGRPAARRDWVAAVSAAAGRRPSRSDVSSASGTSKASKLTAL
jgi:hypothetical protein